MNETDEFIIDAFKQQGLATDELIAEIKAELDAQPDNEVGDRELALMNILMERTGMPKQEIINYLSNELNMEAIDLEQISLPEETLQLVKPEWARQYGGLQSERMEWKWKWFLPIHWIMIRWIIFLIYSVKV